MISSLRLTRELADQVIFGMENQDREYLLDCETETVVVAGQIEGPIDPERFLELPQWRSVDGYNLMERFVASLRNPLFRERLRQILASGRGVFRQFKDTLHERPEIERLWFSFKEREMRAIVADWFNDLREREGLERLEMVGVDAETENLIESDFSFRAASQPELAKVREFDGEALAEEYDGISAEIVELLCQHERRGLPDVEDEGSRVLVSETQGGEFAAFLWSIVRSSGSVRVDHIIQLYVVPEYRGLGLARQLLTEYLGRAHGEGAQEVIVDLPGNTAEFERKLLEYGMVRHGGSVRLNLGRWYRE